MEVGLDYLYEISKYWAFINVATRGEGFLLVDGQKVFINNYNCVGIFENAFRETLQKKKVYKICDCYIDVGCHMGDKSLWFNKINPSAKIIAFEPHPSMYELCRRNLTHVSNLSLYEKGLGSKRGKARMFFDEDHIDTASLNKRSFYLNKNAKKKLRSSTIQVETLDKYYEEIKDFDSIYLKIDVETFEKEVLRGSRKTLSKVKFLEIEVTQDSNNTFSDVVKNFKRRFQLLHLDFLKDKDSHLPRVVTVLLEFLD